VVEMFRFLVIRPPQKQALFSADKSAATYNAIPAYCAPGVSDMAKLAVDAPDRQAGLDAVRAALAKPFDKKFHAALACLEQLSANLAKLDKSAVEPAAGEALRRTVTAGLQDGFPGQSSKDVAAELDALRQAIADRLLGRLIAGPEEDRGSTLDQEALMMRIRLIELISRIQYGQKPGVRDFRALSRARVLLPRLPRQHEPNHAPEAKPKSTEALTVPDRPDHYMALRDEIQHTLSAWKERRVAEATPAHFGDQAFSNWKVKDQTPRIPPKRVQWTDLLPANAIAELKEAGIPFETLSPNAVLDELDERIGFRRSASIVAQPRTIAARIGSRIVSSPLDGVDLSRGLRWAPWPNAALATLDGPATVPSGPGRLGPVRRGDLEIVRQRLKRYEADEIAHIENVLKGEKNERDFRRAETVEAQSASTISTNQLDERDLQSTERFEMESAIKEATSSNVRLEAGISVSASYGPTVGFEVGTQFASEFAQEKSKEAASNFARETTNRALSRVETQVIETRSLRSVRSMKERTLHTIDNSVQPSGHVRGIYRWVNKVYEAQVVNYGIRDIYDFFVPEPAAFWRHVQAGVPVKGVTMEKPEPPQVRTPSGLRPLAPRDLNRETYLDFVARYKATDVTPPPPLTMLINTHINTPAGAGSEGPASGALVSTQMSVPAGYVTKRIKFEGFGLYTDSERNTWLLQFSGKNFYAIERIGDTTTVSEDLGNWLDVQPQRGNLNVGVYYNQYRLLSVTVAVECQRTPETLDAWQIATFDAISMGYAAQLSAYESEVEAANANHANALRGRNPSENEITIRNELKRNVISMMTGQRFEAFDATRAAQGSSQPFPELNFADAEAEGRYVSFCEQAFEWENLTFLLYPYFWGRKLGWPDALKIEEGDPLFAQFLRAGFARVQIPVRPGFEAAVKATFAPENWSGHIWVGDNVPGFEDGGALDIADELRAQTGGDVFSRRDGFVTLRKDDPLVSVTGGTFSADDRDRELRVGGQEYRIVEFIDESTVRIAAPLPARDIDAAPYAMGAKLVGEPWEIVLPTTLVYLQPDDQLNP
jgi:hypothetical protein